MTTLPYDSDAQESLVSRLTVELDAALGLLKEFQQIGDVPALARDHVLPSNLLEQCLALCAEHSALQPEPIRTVHHFACTGGTLICKCIASMPNTQLLSEVDPLSTPVQSSAKPLFSPTDMVTLMRQSTRGATPELIMELFLNNLGVIYPESMRSGLRLVLRDHAHSHYCRGGDIPDRPSLRNLVASRFPVLSVVTVRDPIDSYLSLRANGWIHFTPPTFDEYCARYIAFLRAYQGVPIVRYENFVSRPEAEMQNLCNVLELPLNRDFPDLFDVHKISGDSGRSENAIRLRSRRLVDDALAGELIGSVNYRSLQSMLGY